MGKARKTIVKKTHHTTEQIIRILRELGLRGVSHRYYWADLEPKEGVLDFAAIRQDLEFLKQHHKQLVVFITDKTFSPGRNPLPDDLAQYAFPNLRGYTAKRWDPCNPVCLVAIGWIEGRFAT